MVKKTKSFRFCTVIGWSVFFSSSSRSALSKPSSNDFMHYQMHTINGYGAQNRFRGQFEMNGEMYTEHGTKTMETLFIFDFFFGFCFCFSPLFFFFLSFLEWKYTAVCGVIVNSSQVHYYLSAHFEFNTSLILLQMVWLSYRPKGTYRIEMGRLIWMYQIVDVIPFNCMEHYW